MIIALPIKQSLVFDEGAPFYNKRLPEGFTKFDRFKKRQFHKGNILYDEFGIFEFTKDEFIPKEYKTADEDKYKRGEVYYQSTNGSYELIYIVSDSTSPHAKKPSAYTTAPPTSFKFGKWKHRYAKVGTLSKPYGHWHKDSDDGKYSHSINYDHGRNVWKYVLTNKDSGYTYSTEMQVRHFSDVAIDEPTARAVDLENPENGWVAKSAIINMKAGGHPDIYIRTDDQIAKETDPAGVTFASVTDLAKDTNWGWSFKHSLNSSAFMDGKNYSKTISTTEINITSEGHEKFDCIAISGLKCDLLDIYASEDPESGHIHIEFVGNIDSSISDEERGETTVFYMLSKVYPADSQIGLMLRNTDDKIREMSVGNVVLCKMLDAGFTNLEFTNKYKDYSPFKRDQWGNVEYHKGVLSNTLFCSADIEIENYDRTDRLFKSIGSSTVVINGSDIVDPSDIDSKDFFASTTIIGRVSDFSLKTKIDKKKISQMATYSFTIEENV